MKDPTPAFSKTVYLLPTAIKGLGVAGRTRVIHEASGQCVATLPADLTRYEITAMHCPDDVNEKSGVLDPLTLLDWTGPLSAAHQTLLNAVTPHYASAEAARAYAARHDRIGKGLGVLSNLMFSLRGTQIGTAYKLLAAARVARETAQTGAEKGAATRAEKAAREALKACQLTEAQMNRFVGVSRARLWAEGKNRTNSRRWEQERERRTLIRDARMKAREYLVAHENATGVCGDLRLCLMMTSTRSVVSEAAYRRPHNDGKAPPLPAFLITANVERLRQRRAGERPAPGDAKVREQTRAARIEQANAVKRGRNVPYTALERICQKFTEAADFKTRPVRMRHYAAAEKSLVAVYPRPRQQQAVMRAVRRSLNALDRRGPEARNNELPAALQLTVTRRYAARQPAPMPMLL